MRSHRQSLLVLCGLAVLVALPTAGSAHETRKKGPVELEVGWRNEPAFAYQANGPQVTVSRDGHPVNSRVDLQVDVSFGEETKTLELQPDFVVGVSGDEGTYRAALLPTRPGTYTFRLTGTIAGEEIDEEFTSGEKTFDDVADPRELAFPVADPSNAELAERLTRENRRLNADLAAARDDSDSARTFGYVGIGVGILALIAAVAALARARKRT